MNTVREMINRLGIACNFMLRSKDTFYHQVNIIIIIIADRLSLLQIIIIIINYNRIILMYRITLHYACIIP